MSEETEMGVYPPTAHEPSSIANGKRYTGPNAPLNLLNDLPKRAPAPPPKPRPTLTEHSNVMVAARNKYQGGVRTNEEISRELETIQAQQWELEAQVTKLESEKADKISQGSVKEVADLNTRMDILRHQINQKNTEAKTLQEKEADVKALLKTARETERNFYSQVLESYKTQITNGQCKIPFSELLTRAFALGCQCGVGKITDYLFQWTHIPTLAGEDVETILRAVEEEYQGGQSDDK